MTLEGRGLSCVRSNRVVFTELGFTLAPGGALIVRGPNGSGKTSLLRIVAGFLMPADGALLWDGRPLKDDWAAYRAALHYVGHTDAVKAALTVAENLAFWAAFRGNSGGEGGALARFGLGHLAEVPARLLSAGQRRRLALAQIIASPATLWLLDEPTAVLDDEATATLNQVISEHRAEGGMAMVASHAGLALDGAAALTLGGDGDEAEAPL